MTRTSSADVVPGNGGGRREVLDVCARGQPVQIFCREVAAWRMHLQELCDVIH